MTEMIKTGDTVKHGPTGRVDDERRKDILAAVARAHWRVQNGPPWLKASSARYGIGGPK